MAEYRRIASSIASLALVVLVWLVASPLHAEVGAVDGNFGTSAFYILESIVDDPEPVGNVWSRFNDDDLDRHVLNDAGLANGDGDPSLVRSSLGDPIAAWSMNSPQGFDVVISRFAGSSWTPPVVVAGSPLDELDPFLVVDPADGSIHLLYWVSDPTPRVMHVQAPADLSSWSSAIQVSGPDEIACRPSGMFHSGTLRVVYEVHDYGLGTAPRQIVLATQDVPDFTRSMVAVTQHADPNWPLIHSVGGALWIDWIDTESEMTWTSEQAPGVWDPVQIEVYESTEDRDYHVRGQIRTNVLH